MGFFDFLKGNNKSKALDKTNSGVKRIKGTSKSDGNIVPYFDTLASSANVFSLLWFKDGKYKNYEPQKETVFENDLFRIYISFQEEPSLLVSNLPINLNGKLDVNESIGYYPSYSGMTPDQRWVYLNWLRDITQPVDIGYVFVFYYGLERHLIYGNFKRAADTIMVLRKHHKNGSFQSYSLNALVLSAVVHKDEDALKRIIESAKGEDVNNALLIAKYVMKMDLSVAEIITLCNPVGFKNKRYLKNYPDLFATAVNDQLIDGFNSDSFPFYTLDTAYENEGSIVFANISFSEGARYAMVPSIINNAKFKDSVHSILSKSHETVKRQLKEMRANGNAPTPKQPPKDDAEDDSTAGCPYCNETLDKVPKKKKKCPHCGNYIYVRSSQILYPSKHLTHDEAIATDEFYYLKEYGITNELFNDKVDQLNKNADESVTPIDVCIALYNDLILQTTDKFRLGGLYFRSAFIKYQSGFGFLADLQNLAKIDLSRYEQEGVQQVTIHSVDACEECQQLNGRVFTIQEALSERPIPCKKCTHGKNERGDGWCRCRYVPVGQNESDWW